MEKNNKDYTDNKIGFFILIVVLSYCCSIINVIPILQHLNLSEWGTGDLVGFGSILFWLLVIWFVDYVSSSYVKITKRRVLVPLFVILLSYSFGFLKIYNVSHNGVNNEVTLRNGDKFDSRLVILGKKFSYIIQEKGGVIVNSEEVDRIILNKEH